MENKALEYITLYNVLQIMAPTTYKEAVMYDPVIQKLTHHFIEIIGLVSIGEPGEEIITPCYMCSNSLGMFWVPDMEPTFIQYVKTTEEVDIASIPDKIKEIEEWWTSAQKDQAPVTVEKKGKVSYIKRRDDDDRK